MAVLSWLERICLVNSDNERSTSSLLNRCVVLCTLLPFLEGQAAPSRTKQSNNRSVMPLDVRGRTRATPKEAACFYPCL
uniref:Putative 18s rrna sequence n=1 Tax=Ixodes ricinus TaxID=34613 RepID=A0A0K8RER7_IXORI